MKFVNKYENGGEMKKKPIIKKKAYKDMSFNEKVNSDLKEEANGKAVSGAGTVPSKENSKKKLITKKK